MQLTTMETQSLPKHNGYTISKLISVETVLSALEVSQKDNKAFTVEGLLISKKNAKTWRMFQKNMACVVCGISGSYAAIEKNGSSPLHINLWAVKENGQHVQMTKDHIIPQSKGGTSELSNC